MHLLNIFPNYTPRKKKEKKKWADYMELCIPLPEKGTANWLSSKYTSVYVALSGTFFSYKVYSYYGLSFHVKSVQDTYKYDI